MGSREIAVAVSFNRTVTARQNKFVTDAARVVTSRDCHARCWRGKPPGLLRPFYPARKTENWWLVVGEESSKTLLAIKRVTIGKKLPVRLEFTVPAPGKHELKLFLMSDSYVGVDQEPSFEVTVGEGMEVDEEDEDNVPDDDENMEETLGEDITYVQPLLSI